MLREKLACEKEGILSMLVRRLTRVARMHEMDYGSLTSLRALDRFSVNNDIISVFLQQCTEMSHTKTLLAKNHLWAVFRKFCEIKECEFVLSYGQFFRRVTKLHPEMSTRHQIRLEKNYVLDAVAGIAFSDYGFQLFTSCSKEKHKKSRWRF
jgi:phage/plasmid-associated DNA primase